MANSSDTPDYGTIKSKDLPQDLIDRISDHLWQYAAILRIGSSQIGSGTLIKCNERYGILTAHHVIHRSTPRIDLSGGSSDKLMIAIMKSPHNFEIESKYLVESPVGVPFSDEAGPDLTFIEIKETGKIAEIEARKTFWNLDHDSNARYQDTQNENGIWVMLGAVNEHESQNVDDNGVRRINNVVTGFATPMDLNNVFENNGFDFVDIEVGKSRNRKIPTFFGGASGGGLWRVEIEIKRVTGEFRFSSPVLCGVIYYQHPSTGDVCEIRCHYAKSLYERVFECLCR